MVAGYIIYRFSERVAFILGSCLAGLGMFVSAFDTNITFLLMSMGVVGGKLSLSREGTGQGKMRVEETHKEELVVEKEGDVKKMEER